MICLNLPDPGTTAMATVPRLWRWMLLFGYFCCYYHYYSIVSVTDKDTVTEGIHAACKQWQSLNKFRSINLSSMAKSYPAHPLFCPYRLCVHWQVSLLGLLPPKGERAMRGGVSLIQYKVFSPLFNTGPGKCLAHSRRSANICTWNQWMINV